MAAVLGSVWRGAAHLLELVAFALLGCEITQRLPPRRVETPAGVRQEPAGPAGCGACPGGEDVVETLYFNELPLERTPLPQFSTPGEKRTQ